MKQNSTLLPTIAVALLPKLTCPACWPAYAGLLGSLGLGFIDYTPFLMPMTVIFVALVLATLAYRAPRRRGYKPLWLGSVASALLLVGKFYFDSDSTMYLGLALLIFASVWNTWPMRRAGQASCAACVTEQSGH